MSSHPPGTLSSSSVTHSGLGGGYTGFLTVRDIIVVVFPEVTDEGVSKSNG